MALYADMKCEATFLIEKNGPNIVATHVYLDFDSSESGLSLRVYGVDRNGEEREGDETVTEAVYSILPSKLDFQI